MSIYLAKYKKCGERLTYNFVINKLPGRNKPMRSGRNVPVGKNAFSKKRLHLYPLQNKRLFTF